MQVPSTVSSRCRQWLRVSDWMGGSAVPAAASSATLTCTSSLTSEHKPPEGVTIKLFQLYHAGGYDSMSAKLKKSSLGQPTSVPPPLLVLRDTRG